MTLVARGKNKMVARGQRLKDSSKIERCRLHSTEPIDGELRIFKCMTLQIMWSSVSESMPTY